MNILMKLLILVVLNTVYLLVPARAACIEVVDLLHLEEVSPGVHPRVGV